MKRDEMINLIKSQEPTFLPRARHKGYVCPSCGNGKGRDGDGITKSPGSNSYHCFRCDFHEDILGIIGSYFGIPSFNEQLEKAVSLYGLNKGELSLPSSPKTAYSAVQEEAEKDVDCMELFSEWNKQLNIPGNPGLAYMQSRGLSLGTLNRFKVGYEPKWRHPKTEGHIPSSPRVIIPSSRCSYLARDIRTPEGLSDSQRRYTKSKFGRVRIFNARAFKDSEDIVFVVEGEIDAMSIEEMGFHAVALGSASNRRLLADILRKNRPKATLVILPDNDEAGIEAAVKLKDDLDEAGIVSRIANIFGDCKDANEMLVKNRKAFSARIAAIKALAAADVEREYIEKWDKTNRALLSYLNLHERHKARLRDMGLSDEQIDKFCYRSAPSKPEDVCKALLRHGCSLDNNPLFSQGESGWSFNYDDPAILIPLRGIKGEIQGFERLLDGYIDTLAPSKPRAHFRRGARGLSEVVITDSALSADIVCALSGYSVMAVSDAEKQADLSCMLDSLIEKGMARCRIAYRLHAEGKAALSGALDAKGIPHKTMKWDPRFEGLNDFLADARKREQK